MQTRAKLTRREMGVSSRSSSGLADEAGRPHYSKGSLVEVSTDEEGFRGVWFVATVLESLSKSVSKRRNQSQIKLYVEYQNLLADDGSTPLRERVSLAFVRPLPHPTHDLPPPSFELNDDVDAFHRDGWWTGVISRVLENSRFVVSFENPTDELELGVSDLRLHWEWLDGKWVRSEKQKTAGLMFSSGEKVEISFERVCFRDVWFPAVVLEKFQNDSFLVEYCSPGFDGETGLVKLIVDSLHVRPSPPCLKDKNFVLLEKVDGFFDFGWWSGVITKELADNRYLVFFKHKNVERELNHSELRPHMDWKDCKWFAASQDVLITSDNQEQLGHVYNKYNDYEKPAQLCKSCNAIDKSGETPFSSNSEEYQTQNLSVVITTKKTTKEKTPNGDGTHSLPLKKLKEGNVSSVPSPMTCQLNTLPTDSPSGRFASLASGNSGTNFTNFPARSSHSSANSDSLLQEKSSSLRQADGDPETTYSVKRRGRSLIKQRRGSPQKFPATSPQPSTGVKEGNSVETVDGDFVTKLCMEREIMHPVIIGLECNGAMALRTKRSRKLPVEESPKLARSQKKQVINQFDDDTNLQKKRRGRPPKLLANSVKAPMADGSVILHSLMTEDAQSIGMEDVRVNTEKCIKPAVGNRSGKHLSKRGRRHTISSIIRSPIKDGNSFGACIGTSGGKIDENENCVAKEREVVIDSLPSNVSDDQPLSTWLEGMNSPTTANVSSKIMPSPSVSTKREKNARVLSLAGVDSMGDITPVDNYVLPFVKKAVLWKIVESMEVFRLVPQKPHFLPLNCCKESSREGLAIGNMVNFAGVVERTARLQFDDNKSTIEDDLEILCELETHGFDVGVLQDHLKGLLLIKDKQEQSEDQLKKLENLAAGYEAEKAEVNKEIDEIDKQIRELQEKRSLAAAKREIKDAQIITLNSQAECIKDDLSNIQHDFNCLAEDVPWKVA